MDTITATSITTLQRRHADLESQYDHMIDRDLPRDNALVANMRQAWNQYTDACREVGVCVRPGCWAEVGLRADRRRDTLCTAHAAEWEV